MPRIASHLKAAPASKGSLAPKGDSVSKGALATKSDPALEDALATKSDPALEDDLDFKGALAKKVISRPEAILRPKVPSRPKRPRAQKRTESLAARLGVARLALPCLSSVFAFARKKGIVVVIFSDRDARHWENVVQHARKEQNTRQLLLLNRLFAKSFHH
ncbi:MAG TPA: hypothetical protein IAA69_05170 [Candidatus Aveggerthella stercoripullorum]|uniref:Uncharacterized protein n=1 Tax=Candidatus Aveggerthella stercoripullorum TaxID=2840688 RepID=A0A9D1D377_9ACTN|nr:hypothetical protein [Candidatus Aveggerthella stercoripullorum]